MLIGFLFFGRFEARGRKSTENWTLFQLNVDFLEE